MYTGVLVHWPFLTYMYSETCLKRPPMGNLVALIERWPLDTGSIVVQQKVWDFFERPLDRGGRCMQVVSKAGFTVLELMIWHGLQIHAHVV